MYNQYCLSQQRWPDLVSKLQFSHALGLSGRSWTENESDVCGGRGRYEILYLANVKNPPTWDHWEYYSLHKYLPDFSIVSLRNKSQHIPLTALFWNERSVKKIQCDGSKTPLRTLLLFQGRTAAVGLVLLAVIHLLAGTDSKDKRMGEVCLFQVNIPPGLPTSPK